MNSYRPVPALCTLQIPDGQNLEDISGTPDDTVHENGAGSGIRTLGSSYGTARHLDRRDRTVQ